MFTAGTSKKIWQWEFSDFYAFQDKFTATVVLFKQVSGVYYQSVSSRTALSLEVGLESILVSDY